MKIPAIFRSNVGIPSEWEDDFQDEWQYLLYIRARKVAWLTFIYPAIAIPILIWLSPSFVSPNAGFVPKVFPIIQMIIFLASARLLFSQSKIESSQDLNVNLLLNLNIYLVALILLFDIAFAIIWATSGLNPPYLIGLFVYTSLFYQPNRSNFYIYLFNFSFYIFYILLFPSQPSNQSVALISGIISSFLAMTIACSLYDSKARNFVNRRTIEQQTEALKNANARLNLLANLDGLTLIANRRQFDHHFEQQWQQLGRSNSCLSLLICDVDHFKLFNDNYGHQAGDRCLRQVAEAIENCVGRNGDLVARYGGEEFAVVLPNTDRAGGIAIAEKICEAVKNLQIAHLHSSHEQVTISIGGASIIPNSNFLPENLIARSDQALYHAKQNGRNQFSFLELNTSELNTSELNTGELNLGELNQG
jgi:diguanylate cyclase (GGDEF)-like protein